MDELLLALKNVSEQLLPILGAVVLFYLCIVFRKLGVLLESLSKTVDNLSPTIKLVDQSLEKVQTPLDTAVKLSHTIDNVHDKTVDSVAKATTYVNENMDEIKSYVNDKVNKVKEHFEKEKNEEE
ncbi:MAG TPA: hypothetical protein DHS57_03615 [Erysipelotrichaceae bacterium]|nr:hypothetical protein [Erysipelotrichaceae bacterium]HCY06365.1 hypothetical protein [Erysipelotrichaceae bacterium]